MQMNQALNMLNRLSQCKFNTSMREVYDQLTGDQERYFPEWKLMLQYFPFFFDYKNLVTICYLCIVTSEIRKSFVLFSMAII